MDVVNFKDKIHEKLNDLSIYVKSDDDILLKVTENLEFLKIFSFDEIFYLIDNTNHNSTKVLYNLYLLARQFTKKENKTSGIAYDYLEYFNDLFLKADNRLAFLSGFCDIFDLLYNEKTKDFFLPINVIENYLKDFDYSKETFEEDYYLILIKLITYFEKNNLNAFENNDFLTLYNNISKDYKKQNSEDLFQKFNYYILATINDLKITIIDNERLSNILKNINLTKCFNLNLDESSYSKNSYYYFVERLNLSNIFDKYHLSNKSIKEFIVKNKEFVLMALEDKEHQAYSIRADKTTMCLSKLLNQLEIETEKEKLEQALILNVKASKEKNKI